MKAKKAILWVVAGLALLVWGSGTARGNFIIESVENIGPGVNRGAALNSVYTEACPTVSADGLSLFFCSSRPGGTGNDDLWVATRANTSEDWPLPVNLGSTVNSSAADGWPCLSSDGLTLYFASSRPGGEGDWDIWMTRRATLTDAWGPPENLGSPVNSAQIELSPCVSADGLSLYFASGRAPGSNNFCDIWVSTRESTDGEWGEPVRLAEPLNSTADDVAPWISADQLSLYFESSRSPGLGSYDIWVSTRSTTADPWGSPVNLGAPINDVYSNGGSCISADGLSLYFHSYTRGDWDIYIATRQTTSEPFGDVQTFSADESTPSISSDGLSLYFTSWRPEGVGGLDLYMATRDNTTQQFGPAANLGPTVNSELHEFGPYISYDGLSLYFAAYTNPNGSGLFVDIFVTHRASLDEDWGVPQNLGAPVNLDNVWDAHPCLSADGLSLYFCSYRLNNYDLFVATRPSISDPWGTPVPINTVNSSSYEYWPSVTADELWLFFTSGRAPSSGSSDIWVSTRKTKSDPWGVPVNLGPSVNSSWWDGQTSVSPDGSMLYFASPRLGHTDIWQAVIAPVFLMPDLNSDAIVNAIDFSKLAAFWLAQSTLSDIAPPPDGDGVVDARDLEGLAHYWLRDVGMIYHWEFDELEGNQAHDIIGQKTGNLLGGPTWVPTDGRIGGALQFDGIDDYVSTSFLLNPEAESAFSVFAWVKGGAPGQVIIAQNDGSSGHGSSWLSLDPVGGNIMTSIHEPLASPLTSEVSISDGAWHEVGLVVQWPRRRLYVDGVKVAEDANDLTVRVASTGGMYFGTSKTRKPGSFWFGMIDDIRVYDRAKAL